MSVICDKCGEELMGAVNRCWKCGTPFSRVEANDQPPIRRAPVLAAYLAAADSPSAEMVYLAEAADPPPPTETTADRRAWPTWFRGLDHASLAAAVLALFASWVAYYSAWGIPLAAFAVVFGANRIHHRRTWPAWAAFLLCIGAMLCGMLRLMATLYSALTGGNLFILLFGP